MTADASAAVPAWARAAGPAHDVALTVLLEGPLPRSEIARRLGLSAGTLTRLARPLLDVDFTHTALYAEMFRRLGLHLGGGQEEIVAVTLNRTEAARLDTRIGAAAFALSRLGCHRGAPLEWRHTVIRGDRFRLLSRFSPGSGYTLHLGTQPSSSAAGADAPGQPGTNQFCGSENP